MGKNHEQIYKKQIKLFCKNLDIYIPLFLVIHCITVQGPFCYSLDRMDSSVASVVGVSVLPL